MQELMKNAWLGWKMYTDNGKFAALFLVALLLFWFWLVERKKKEMPEAHFHVILYATVMSVCCICPITAAVLMLYQTRFYDYQWIWNMIPLTIVIALVGTLFWTEFSWKNKKQKAGITVLIVVLFYLSGSLMKEVVNTDAEAEKHAKAKAVVQELTESTPEGTICLFAPQEVMEYARAIDGRIYLPYGRNMWDKALNAYSYETYGEAEEKLYAWMSYVEEYGEITAHIEPNEALSWAEDTESIITAKECMTLAAELGVTRILLPENLLEEDVDKIEKLLGVEAERLAGYYFFCIS